MRRTERQFVLRKDQIKPMEIDEDIPRILRPSLFMDDRLKYAKNQSVLDVSSRTSRAV